MRLLQILELCFSDLHRASQLLLPSLLPDILPGMLQFL